MLVVSKLFGVVNQSLMTSSNTFEILISHYDLFCGVVVIHLNVLRGRILHLISFGVITKACFLLEFSYQNPPRGGYVKTML